MDEEGKLVFYRSNCLGRIITTLVKPVPMGVEGAISLECTLASVVGVDR